MQQDQPELARQHWRICLETALQVPERYQILVMLDAIMGVAALESKSGDLEYAVTLLAFVQQAAAIDRTTQAKAERLLAWVVRALLPEHSAAAQARGQQMQLEETLAEILAEAAT